MKANKKGNAAVALWLIAIALGAIVVVGVFGGSMAGLSIGDNIKLGNQEESLGGSCPAEGGTDVTMTYQNPLNTTSSETFSVTTYLVGADGDYKTNTDGTETLNCGEEYTLAVVRTNADSGDSSRIKNILIGPGAELNADGTVTFTPTKDSYALRLGLEQHGVLEFNGYDLDESAGLDDDQDNNTADYETDGVTFHSTTTDTAKAIGAGGSLNYRIKARSTLSDTNFNDHYTLILVEAPVATWEAPGIKVDGQTLSDAKGSLTPDEEKQFSGYEYIYKIDKSILDGNDGITVEVYLEALDGVNPSTDPEVDFASAGRFLSVDGFNTKVGAADDTSGSSVVYTVQDVTLDIS